MASNSYQLSRRQALAMLVAGGASVGLGLRAFAQPKGANKSKRLPTAAGSIVSADVLARTKLLRAEVEFIRLYMGKPSAPTPRMRIGDAQPRVVQAQAEVLYERTNRLSFDVIRNVGKLAARPDGRDALPSDVLNVVAASLERVRLVKEALGITEVAYENAEPRDTTPSAVFHEVVAATADVDMVVEGTTSASDVFRIVTNGVHLAAAIQATIPGAILPNEPDFEPNKVSKDVYKGLLDCFALLKRVAAARSLDVLDLQVSQAEATGVSPLDVSDLASIMTAELAYVHSKWTGVGKPNRAYYPGVRYPAHVSQRAGMLKLLLEDILSRSPSTAPVAGQDVGK